MPPKFRTNGLKGSLPWVRCTITMRSVIFIKMQFQWEVERMQTTAPAKDRKSISGYLFTLAESPISWQAKKQAIVALSTVEAEYVALAQATKELIWLQNLLKDLQNTSPERSAAITKARFHLQQTWFITQRPSTLTSTSALYAITSIKGLLISSIVPRRIWLQIL